MFFAVNEKLVLNTENITYYQKMGDRCEVNFIGGSSIALNMTVDEFVEKYISAKLGEV